MPSRKRKVKRPKVYIYIPPKKKKRPGRHSKNASKGQNAYKKLILTSNKGLLKGDYLIDDNTWNGAGDFEGKHIHFGTDHLFMNWDDVLEYFENHA